MQSFIQDIKHAQSDEKNEKVENLKKLSEMLEIQGNSRYVSQAYNLWENRI